MAVSHRTVISFGLVAIPVALYTATQDNDIRFNQLHKEDNARIRYKKTCANCGKEIGPGSAIFAALPVVDEDPHLFAVDELSGS